MKDKKTKKNLVGNMYYRLFLKKLDLFHPRPDPIFDPFFRDVAPFPKMILKTTLQKWRPFMECGL